MKKLIVSAAFISFVLGGCSASNEVVVQTKFGELTQSEFYEDIKSLAGSALLEQVVMDDILSELYEVTDEEIQEKYDEYAEQYGDSFGDLLTSYGYTEESFKTSIRFEVLQQKALEDVEITEEEIATYYEQAKFELHARHILVDSESEAQEVLKRIQKGEDFAEIAKELSTDSSSAENGGDLDWFTVGSMVDSFNDAVYALKVGEISEPIESDYGYHIIELLDKREVEDYGTLKDEKENIIKALKEKKAAATDWSEVEARLLKEAEVEIKDSSLKEAFSSIQLDEEE